MCLIRLCVSCWQCLVWLWYRLHGGQLESWDGRNSQDIGSQSVSYVVSYPCQTKSVEAHVLDIGWLCISRFILLDSMLLFFTFTTTLGLVKFRNQRHEWVQFSVMMLTNSPFGEDWWMWLVFTGWSIGCVCSVKWVGQFVTALVGLCVIEDLWDKFGDLSMPLVRSIQGSLADSLANIYQTLGRAHLMSDCPPILRLRGLFQNPLSHSQSIRAW